MQRFISSSISVRRNRFKETGSKFDDIQIKSVDIEKSFESLNSEKLSFTNYAKSSEQKVYNVIKNEYIKISNNDITIFGDYQPDEFYYNGKCIDRLLDIINESNDKCYTRSDLPNIYKLKHRKESEVHLYVQIDNESLFVLLIDLFHLSLPADIYVNGRLIKRTGLKDLDNIYSKFKNNKYNLNNITRC